MQISLDFQQTYRGCPSRKSWMLSVGQSQLHEGQSRVAVCLLHLQILSQLFIDLFQSHFLSRNDWLTCNLLTGIWMPPLQSCLLRLWLHCRFVLYLRFFCQQVHKVASVVRSLLLLLVRLPGGVLGAVQVIFCCCLLCFI